MAVNRPWITPRVAHQRTKDNSKFYNSRAWRKIRAAFLQEYPDCVQCKRDDIVTPGNVVDHIKPITEGGHKTDRTNLQTMCKACHDKKSAYEGGKQRGMGNKVITVKACTSHDNQLFTHNK